MQLHYGSCHIAFGTLSCRLVFAMGTPWGEPTAAVRMSLSFFLVLYSFPRLPSFPSPFSIPALLSHPSGFPPRTYALFSIISSHFAFLASSPVDAGSICPDATMAACYRRTSRVPSRMSEIRPLLKAHTSISSPLSPFPILPALFRSVPRIFIYSILTSSSALSKHPPSVPTQPPIYSKRAYTDLPFHVLHVHYLRTRPPLPL
ncbi:hypothetical protein C8J57DRAFT_1540345 [Mycena rebaudengoi]|nr:hypothetical protein C8J57DRAFT_1540345 [Mycena rebaudengoi]